MRTIAFFLLFFIFFFKIVRNFLEVLPGHGWSENRIPNKSESESESEARPEPESEAVSSVLVRKPNNCSQFDLDAAVTAATCARQVAVPWLTTPEYRTIVTSYAYMNAVKGVSLATLVKN